MLNLEKIALSSGGVVLKLLAHEAWDLRLGLGLVATISEIGYLLLPSPNTIEIHVSLKHHKSSKQPNPKNNMNETSGCLLGVVPNTRVYQKGEIAKECSNFHFKEIFR